MALMRTIVTLLHKLTESSPVQSWLDLRHIISSLQQPGMSLGGCEQVMAPKSYDSQVTNEAF